MTEYEYNQDEYEEADRQMHLDKQHELFFGGLLMIAIIALAAYALYLCLFP